MSTRSASTCSPGPNWDYTDELMGAHFTVRNPNAKSACGCGTSFAID